MEDNPINTQGQTPSVMPGPTNESKALGWLKGFFIFIVLVLVVIASFWLSFQLGRRILSPRGERVLERIKAEIPEPPPSIKSLQKLGIAVSEEARDNLMKALKKEEPLQKPMIGQRRVVKPQRLTIKKMERTKVAGQLYCYKVQVGVFSDESAAQKVAGNVKNAGFGVFVKQVGNGWRVQAGAFKTRAAADKMCGTLKGSGISSKVIYENK